MQKARLDQQPRSVKIVLTGGHAATTALAVVEALNLKHKNLDLIWIGPRSAMEGEVVETAAEKIMKEAGVRVVTIDAGRLKRRGSYLLRLLALLKVPFGLLQAFYYVFQIRPSVVISFGGFAAFPVVFSAWLLGIPSVIHEQIVGVGLANRLSIPFATKITVAREVSLSSLPKKKSVLIGNPQIARMFTVAKKTVMSRPPVIYITGGSSGSQIINKVAVEALPTLLLDYRVVHQVGENNLDEYRAVRNNLPLAIQEEYKVFGYVSPYEQVKYVEQADLIIARAGANTVADVVNSQRPAILIPIPWSIGDEQTKNAQAAKSLGIATVLTQDEISPDRLIKEIRSVMNNWEKMVKNAQKGEFFNDRQAAQKLVEIVESLLL